MEGKKANFPLIIGGFILLVISVVGFASTTTSGVYSWSQITFVWFGIAVFALGLIWWGAPKYP